MAKQHSVPADYEAVFREYFDFIKAGVARAGIDPQDVEDVSMDIWIKFREKEFLAVYDPTKVFETASGPRTASFKSLLGSFVSKYVLTYRDKQYTRQRREPIRCEMPITNHEGEPQLWLEVYAPTVAEERALEDIDLIDTIRTAYNTLATNYANRTDRRRHLPRVFQMLVEQTFLNGQVSRKSIAAAFGVSETAVYLMIRDLREALRDLGFDAWLVGEAA